MRRPDFAFEFKYCRKPQWRDHYISVDVFSLVDGEFELFSGWGGRWRRLPKRMAEGLIREAGVQERAFDAFRDLVASERLHAAGL
ncbi:MAG TPA: hypothetical protein VFO85_08925 [Vicinamibacteria bacterium]|nr:hypothetical protein [Vicinamibacteria bacterium]